MRIIVTASPSGRASRKGCRDSNLVEVASACSFQVTLVLAWLLKIERILHEKMGRNQAKLGPRRLGA